MKLQQFLFLLIAWLAMVQGQTDVFGNPIDEVESENGGGPIPSPTRPGGVKPVFDAPSERTPAPRLASMTIPTPIPSSAESILSTPSSSSSLLASFVPSDVPSNAPSDMPSFSPSGEAQKNSRFRV